MSDTSLKEGESDGFVAVELVSPAWTSDSGWNKKIDELYKIVEAQYEIRVNYLCSTHIHVSPSRDGSKKWLEAEIVEILKWAFIFDSSITDMLPPDRRQNKYALSNFDSHLANKDLLELCQAAKASGDNAPLFAYLDSQKTFEDLKNLHSERQVRFNLKNLTDSKGTVEFRCPPPSRTAVTACHWAAWALSFVFAAINAERHSRRPRRNPGSVLHLRAYLWSGYQMLKLEETSQAKILIWGRLGVVQGQASDSPLELVNTEVTEANLDK